MKTIRRTILRVLSTILACLTLFAAAPGALAQTQFTYIPQRLNCSTGVCVTVSTSSASSSTKTTSTVNGQYYTAVSATAQEKQILNMVNEERAKKGLPAYKLDGRLSAIARAKSADMVNNRYFAHQSPTLGSVRDQIAAAGLSYRCVNENIARYGSLTKAMAGLMSSTGHRNNILSKTYNTIGIGITQDTSGNFYITQVFVCA